MHVPREGDERETLVVKENLGTKLGHRSRNRNGCMVRFRMHVLHRSRNRNGRRNRSKVTATSTITAIGAAPYLGVDYSIYEIIKNVLGDPSDEPVVVPFHICSSGLMLSELDPNVHDTLNFPHESEISLPHSVCLYKMISDKAPLPVERDVFGNSHTVRLNDSDESVVIIEDYHDEISFLSEHVAFGGF